MARIGNRDLEREGRRSPTEESPTQFSGRIYGRRRADDGNGTELGLNPDHFTIENHSSSTHPRT